VPFVDERISNDPEDLLLYQASLLLGCWTMSLHFCNFVGRCIPRPFLDKNPCLERLFTAEGVRAEFYSKQAAAHKMNSATKNALDVVTVNDPACLMRTHYGQALLVFSKTQEVLQPVGGFVWTWKRIFNKELLRKEGIWIPARFLAGNVAMVIVSVFVLMSGMNLTNQVVHNFGKENADDLFNIIFETAFSSYNITDEVMSVALAENNVFKLFHKEGQYKCLGLSQEHFNTTNMACNEVAGVFECEGINASSICTLFETNFTGNEVGVSGFEDAMKSAVDIAFEQTKNSFYPESQYMLVVPLVVGTCVAFLSSVALTVIYIPSIISSILQLRSGVIPTFRDRAKFGRHRFGAELVTILLGSLVWGTLFSSILVGGLIGTIIFLLLWQVTERFTLRLLAFLCGMTVIIIFRVLLLLCVRTKLYEAFYRPKPARANLTALILEAANFALSFGFIIVRVVKLLLTAAFYIGRIDTPFLAPGVGNPWGYFELDSYPTIFVKDMLAHDAHRHPFLELLGSMYMLKLRYGERFGTRAGSCWRLIFVSALMPWMSKYRIMTRPDMREEVTDLSLTDRSSIRFMSLCRSFRQVDIPGMGPLNMSGKTEYRNSAAREELEQSAENFSGEIEMNGVFDADENTERSVPSLSSTDEKVLWLEGRNAVLGQEIAALKRELLLLEMKAHRRSSLTQLNIQTKID